MDALVLAGLFLVWNFPHFYGAAENRLFLEHGEYLPGRHFRVYHLWLAWLFAGSSFLIYVLSRSVLLTAAYLLYAPFGLDWVWWVLRYVDIRFLKRNDYDDGVGKAWHSREDWDNYGRVPLVFGTYWWWYVFGALSAALGVVSLYV